MVEKIYELPLNKLRVSIFNVRKNGALQDIDELSQNILEIGVKNPIVVHEYKKNKYDVISGQRRYIAARKAGLKTVPCIIRKNIEPIDCIIESFSENIFRSEMTLPDKASATQSLMKYFKNDKTKVAKKLGVQITTINKYLDVLDLSDDLKKVMRTKQMNFETAKTIYKKTKHDEKHRKKLIISYIKKNSKEKTDFYHAIKETKGGTKIEDVEKNYQKIKKTQKTHIRIPTNQNEFIQTLAKEKNMEPEMVISNLLTIGIMQYKRGGIRF